MSAAHLPIWKKILFSSIIIALILAVPLALIGGYLGYRKLTLSYEYCGSYAQIDDRLGWRLAANQTSCVGLQNRLKGEVYFSSKVYTNSAQLRSTATKGEPIPNAIATIGDSWVFGYGVDLEEAWPHKLSKQLDHPVNNLGVPSYSSAQTYLLLERDLAHLNSGVVIHYNNRMWKRSICVGNTPPTEITEPCFWADTNSQKVTLTTPPGTYVSDQAAKNILPGGIGTSGHDPWHYYLVVRPLEILRTTLGTRDTKETLLWNESHGPISNDVQSSILDEELKLYSQLMKKHGFTLVWVDPYGFYRESIERLPQLNEASFVYMGQNSWNELVEKPAADLGPHEKYIPHDGHFTAKMNTFVADGIAEFLRAEGLF